MDAADGFSWRTGHMKCQTTLALSLLLLSTGCGPFSTNEYQDDLERELEEARAQLDEVRSEVSQLQDAVLELESSFADLQMNIDWFQWEDWRIVVPLVVNSAIHVEDAVSDVEDELGDVWRIHRIPGRGGMSINDGGALAP
jgi:hypothetical protein